MAGRVDVFMTDYPYSRKLLDSSDWVQLIAPPKPFHVLPYGYAASPADAQWLARLRSEEHTSELQSPCNLVCRLLLEKKKHSCIPSTLSCQLSHAVRIRIR